MKTFGAQYVVYEDSGFLAESVERIYPLMDRIVFLVGWKPWNGAADPDIPRATLSAILGIPDPDGKFIVKADVWRSEKDQRNEALGILRRAGCEWCMIVDDDELFNRKDVDAAKRFISEGRHRMTAYLAAQAVYWKDVRTVISGLTMSLPLFAHTGEGEVEFNEGRCYTVRSGFWHCFPPEVILCHHMSYVRDDGQMRRKLASFTHADPRLEKWYREVWLKWEPGMENLHPNPDAPQTFRKAVPAELSPWRLEPLPQP